jgi:hypothetical protein
MRLIPERASYTGFLGVMALALIVSRVSPAGPLLAFAMELVIVAAMAGVVWRLGARPGLVFVVTAAAVLSEASAIMTVVSNEPIWVILNHALAATFLGLVLSTILMNVWRQQTVRTDTIVGGIVVYLMLGVAFAIVFQLVEFVAPGSFAVSNPEAGRWGVWQPEPGVYPRLFFFSFVTLTTLGYGDVVPASAPSAALTSLEAVMGALYLTVLIARLVGLHIAASRDTPNSG